MGEGGVPLRDGRGHSLHGLGVWMCSANGCYFQQRQKSQDMSGERQHFAVTCWLGLFGLVSDGSFKVIECPAC